jgi:predicted RNase H-like nuclease (RuvC/YqgF family)
VLSLADKIDEQRVSTEQTDAKIKELQSVIDNQQSEIANYQQQVEIVKEETDKKISNESECRKLYSDNPECTVGNKIYRNKSNFNEFIKGEHIRPSDINDYKRMYDICQEIISNCD